MSIEALNWAFKQPTKGPAKAVLIVLADHADQDGSSWPSVERQCFRSGFSERTVRMALRQLEQEGKIRSQIGVGRGHVSRYQVLYNQDEQPEAASKRPNGAEEKVQEMPLSVVKGAGDAPIGDPAKGASPPVKGASPPVKGAGAAPEPLRTTMNHQKREARSRSRDGFMPLTKVLPMSAAYAIAWSIAAERAAARDATNGGNP